MTSASMVWRGGGGGGVVMTSYYEIYLTNFGKKKTVFFYLIKTFQMSR